MSSKLLGDAFDADIKPIAYKVVMLKLVDAARDDGTKIYPSVKTIAKAAGVSERHTKRVLHGFVSIGLLRVTQIGGKGRGDNLADLYPGSGAVARAWETWRGKFALPTRLLGELPLGVPR